MTIKYNDSTKPLNKTYVHFLMALYQEGEGKQSKVFMSPFDQRLLELITAHHALRQTLSMMQILNAQDHLFLGSSSVSRKVDSLIERGFVRIVSDVADRRIKFAEPTEKTLAYFDGLNAWMVAQA